MAYNIPSFDPENTSIIGQIGKLNALQKGGAEARYAGQTAYANALSKLAYSNLMGPQFMAKLLGNEDIVANMNKPGQRANAIDQVTQAAGGGPTGAGGGQMPPQNYNPIGALGSFLVDKIGSIFSGTPNQAQGQPAQNPLARNAPLPTNQTSEDTSTEAPTQPSGQGSAEGFDPNSDLVKARDAWNKSPEGIKSAQKEGYFSYPPDEKLLNWYQNRLDGKNQPQEGEDKFAENVGKYKGQKEEGKEQGSIRAKDEKELNDIYENNLNKGETFDELNTVISSPTMRQIRQIPLAGQHEINWYKYNGTPEQKEVVGRLMSLTGSVVLDAAGGFKGAFRSGEQSLLNTMKVNPGDPVEVAIGKAEELTYLNKFIGERSRLASRIMKTEHIDKGDALEKADRQMDGPTIRKQVHNKLNPLPTDIDIKHMAEKYKISTKEVRKRLKAKGIEV